MAKVKIIKNKRDPPLITSKQLLKFKKILRNTTQVIVRHRICLQTDGRTDRQTDMVKPVYPLQLRCGGYNDTLNTNFQKDQRTLASLIKMD
jgi:hypothetical protein